jgi:hypothetical protein
MITRLMYVLAVLITLAAQASAQPAAILEERVRLRYVPPSHMIERLNTLAGIPSATSRMLEMRADDPSGTLLVRIPATVGDHIDRERLRLFLRDQIARLDQPQQLVQLHIYLVETAALTDREFLALDRELRTKATPFPAGVRGKGVIYEERTVHPSLEILNFGGVQSERYSISPRGPVTATGRLLPHLREDGRVMITLTMRAQLTAGETFQNGTSELQFNETAAPPPNAPLVVVAGTHNPIQPRNEEPFPGRHELMLYIWAQPAAQQTTTINR